MAETENGAGVESDLLILVKIGVEASAENETARSREGVVNRVSKM